MASSSEITFVLGGARSGKSVYAEGLTASYAGTPVYIATATAGDAEMAERIQRHQARRGARWRTVEAPLALAEAIAREAGPRTPVLVDCLTLWMSNLLLADRDLAAEGERLVAALGRGRGHIVLVSNEVGLGIVPDHPLARRFRDEAGRLHQTVAAAADRVVLMVAGLPQVLKQS